MTIAETDIFEQAGGMSHTDIPDGLAVTDSDGKEIHFLNPVAGAVYLLCDGALDVRSIAQIFKEEYALPEAPVQDIAACIADLGALGIIRKIG